MAELVTVARPYAKAAFQHALETGRLDQWSTMLSVAAAVSLEPNLASYLGSPRLTADKLTEIFADVCGDRLDAEGRNFIAQLASNKRLATLPMISALYEQNLATHRNTAEVQVLSAYELTAADRDKLTAALRKKLGKEVRLTADIDKNLIGGVVIRAGDLVIDNSVRGKLNRLAKELNS